MGTKIFLMDSNSYITPYKTYYNFDFAKGFWNTLESGLQNRSIVMIDKVKEELLAGEDDLSDWVKNLEGIDVIDHRTEEVLNVYGSILQYVQTIGLYKVEALTEWSRENIADAWIIAVAKVYGFTIVTFEKPNNGLHANNPSRNAKIPDVAKVFGVDTIDLFDMMRYLNFKL